MIVKCKDEICQYLKIPSIPKKKWDGKTPYGKGVTIVETILGEQLYAVSTYDENTDKQKIVKVFSTVQFCKVLDTFIVPDYMSDIRDIEDMDLDAKSKTNAERLLTEAEIIQGGIDILNNDDTKNEYYFDFIKNDAQAKAFIRSYNEKNKIKGRIPKNHEGLIMRLAVIYKDTNNKNK